MTGPPIVDLDTAEPGVFEPADLLDCARCQKGLPPGRVPPGCLLDMDEGRRASARGARRAGPLPTHLAFYAGWPSVFSALPVAKAVFERRAKQ